MVLSKRARVIGACILVQTLLILTCSPPEACSFGGIAKTWIDSNENGEWDEGEEALPGVEITITGELDVAKGGISNEEGEAVIEILHMSCGANFEICADEMPGYRLSTSRCVAGDFPGGFFDEGSSPDQILFGWIRVDD